MTTEVDIANRALLLIGLQSQITSLDQDMPEAAAINAVFDAYRDNLLRMAPWDCALNYANLTYITSTPGTPENQSAGTTLWQKGQPAPPWIYEYQYPVSCLKACFIIPANQTGYAGSVPITTAVTGNAPQLWQGPPVRFKVAIDQFYPVISAGVASGGAGYAVGDLITLASGAVTDPPIGAPAVLLVTAVIGGAVTSVKVVDQIAGETSDSGGSYFAIQSNPVAQGSTTGSGTGATFNLTFGSQGDQRVILTNQEFATLAYVKRVTNPNVMDPMFVEALVGVLAAHTNYVLTKDKAQSNLLIELANGKIREARKADGNEGLTINDYTPDWIRVRGAAFTEYFNAGPWSGFDWGPFWPAY